MNRWCAQSHASLWGSDWPLFEAGARGARNGARVAAVGRNEVCMGIPDGQGAAAMASGNEKTDARTRTARRGAIGLDGGVYEALEAATGGGSFGA